MAEHEPLLRGNNHDDSSEHGLSKDHIVDFATDDPEDPLNWPKPFKWTVVGLLVFMAMTTTFNCISVMPVANSIIEDLNDGDRDKTQSVLLVTIWEIGEAAGPLFIAPLSEAVGRYPVYNVANICFVATTVFAVLCRTAPAFITARALTGLAVAANVLNPAIVGDMFVTEERGSPMSMVMLAPMVGGAIGPAVAGTIAESSTWRNILWVSVGIAGVCELCFLLFFRETYKVIILRRKATKLRKESGNDQFTSIYDSGDASAKSPTIWQSILRPFHVFWSSSVLMLASLFGSMAFSFFYVMSTSFPDILEAVYKLPPSLIGACFMSFSVGSVLSIVTSNFCLDRIYVYLKNSNKGVDVAEYRLPISIFGAFGLPLTIAFYGWTPQLHLPLPVSVLSVGLLGAMTLWVYVPLSTYVVDAFGIYSASAMTAVIVTRCLAGTFLPLLTQPLVDRLDYGWSFTVMAGMALCCAPIPVLLYRYGPRWRQRSFYSRTE